MNRLLALPVLPFYLLGKHRRWAIFLLVMVTSVSPRIHLGTLQYGKLLDIRCEDLLIVVLLVSWVIRGSFRLRKVIISPLGPPILAYLILALILTCAGLILGWLDPMRAFFFFLKEVEFTLFFFITVNFIRDVEDVKTVITAFFVGGVANALYLIYQVATGRLGGMADPLDFYRYYGISMIGESGPGVTGNYFSLITFLSMAIYLFASTKMLRLAALALTAAAMGGLVGSMSRTSFVGFVATMPFLVVMVLTVRKATGSRRRLVALFCFIAGFALLMIAMMGKLKEELPYAARIADLSVESYQIHRVEDVYEDYYKVIRKSPVLGLGKSITGQQRIPGVRLEDFYGEAHNQYLRIMAEMGIVGLAAFLYIFFLAGRCSYRVLRMGDPYFRTIGLVCLVYIVFLLITSMAQDVFIMARAIELFWVLLGLCMVAYRWERKMLL